MQICNNESNVYSGLHKFKINFFWVPPQYADIIHLSHLSFSPSPVQGVNLRPDKASVMRHDVCVQIKLDTKLSMKIYGTVFV